MAWGACTAREKTKKEIKSGRTDIRRLEKKKKRRKKEEKGTKHEQDKLEKEKRRAEKSRPDNIKAGEQTKHSKEENQRR